MCNSIINLYQRINLKFSINFDKPSRNDVSIYDMNCKNNWGPNGGGCTFTLISNLGTSTGKYHIPVAYCRTRSSWHPLGWDTVGLQGPSSSFLHLSGIEPQYFSCPSQQPARITDFTGCMNILTDTRSSSYSQKILDTETLCALETRLGSS